MRNKILAVAVLLGVAACSDTNRTTATAPARESVRRVSGTTQLTGSTTSTVATNECATPGTGWIFCDDFESDRTAKYFEYDNAGGKFVRATATGVGGSTGMRATYTKGQAGAGSLHLAFGRTPTSYIRPVDAGTANYREVYWRFFVKRDAGWVGNGADKLTRAASFAKADWSEAMIAHGWTSSSDRRYLVLEPASGTDTKGNLVTVGYNDFNHLSWLGTVQTAQAEEDSSHVNKWECYEFHAKLNDAGQANGVFELTVDGQPSAKKTGLNWVGAYKDYGINAVFLEQFENAGAPAANVRTLDNFVVSTQPIGCGGNTNSSAPSNPVAPAPVASVTVTPATSNGVVGSTLQLNASASDASGNTLSGRTMTWASSNTAVASVNASGLVTLNAIGSASIYAASENKYGGATVTAAAVPVASVTVSTPSSNGTIGQTIQLSATTTDASGNVLSGRTVTWTSSNASAISVNAAGLATLNAAGSATITATSEGKSSSTVVSAKAAVTASKLIISNIASQTTGTAFSVTVTLADANNNAVSNTGAAGTVTLARQAGTGSLGGTLSATMPVGSSSVTISGVTYSKAESGIVLSATGAGAGSLANGKSGLSNAFAAAAPVVVTAPTNPTGGSSTAAVVEDFSGYTSTSNFLANAKGMWIPAEALNASHVVLDQSVGYGSSTQSMRYDWPNNGSTCGDYQMRPGFFKIPGKLTHVWLEFVVRFNTNFTVDAGNSACGKEYKLGALGDYSSGIGRWNIPEMQQGQFVTGYPGNDAGFILGSTAPNSLWDGKPHVFRIEAQLGNGSPTGVFKFWIDGVLKVNQSGFTTDPSHHVIDIFGPGLNINQGPAISGMQMWWHKISVFSANPGWQ